MTQLLLTLFVICITMQSVLSEESCGHPVTMGLCVDDMHCLQPIKLEPGEKQCSSEKICCRKPTKEPERCSNGAGQCTPYKSCPPIIQGRNNDCTSPNHACCIWI